MLANTVLLLRMVNVGVLFYITEHLLWIDMLQRVYCNEKECFISKDVDLKGKHGWLTLGIWVKEMKKNLTKVPPYMSVCSAVLISLYSFCISLNSTRHKRSFPFTQMYFALQTWFHHDFSHLISQIAIFSFPILLYIALMLFKTLLFCLYTIKTLHHHTADGNEYIYFKAWKFNLVS